MIVIYSLLVVLLAMWIARYPRNSGILHPKKIFLFFYVVVHISGFFVAALINYIFDGYKYNNDQMMQALILVTYGLFAFIFFYYILSGKWLNFISLPKINEKVFSALSPVYLIFGIAGLLIYIANTGFVLFQDGGYENKNLANTGMGFARILYGSGLSYGVAAFLIFRFNKERFKKAVGLSIILGGIIFIAIGGGRSAAINLFSIVIIIAIFYNKITNKKLASLMICLFILIILLTMFRYKENFELLSMMYKIQGSFSPIDSVATISESIPKSYPHQPQLFFNSLLTLIPRIFWPDKPLDILVPSVYFTNVILEYGSFLTISPTLIGELYIYGGYFGITLGMALVALLVRFYSRIYKKSFNNGTMRLFFVMNALFPFSLMREGVSIFLRDQLLMLIIFMTVIISVKITSSLKISH